MGFCIDVFEAVVQSLPYDVPLNYVQFRDETGHSKGTYDDLVYSVYLEV
jgi:ionotropic glutamate receptor